MDFGSLTFSFWKFGSVRTFRRHKLLKSSTHALTG